MAADSDDDVFVDGPSTRTSRAYRWVIDHLAKFPGRVTIVTFVAGVVVTFVVAMLGGDESPTTLVGLVATLWALFFAVMIYLLTARDTDKVLDEISDLREQLATALTPPETLTPSETLTPAEVLASPEREDGAGAADAGTADRAVTGEGADTTDTAGTDTAAGAPETGPASETGPDRAGSRRESPSPADGSTHGPRPSDGSANERYSPDGQTDDRQLTGGSKDNRRPTRPSTPDRSAPGRPIDRTAPRLLEGSDAIADGMPVDLLRGWSSATGLAPDVLARAWTRDPRSEHQWVVETTDGERWVVFSRGPFASPDSDNRTGRTGRPAGIGVIPLSEVERRRHGHRSHR